MTDQLKIVRVALDEGLAERTMRLFDVLVADYSDEGMERFMLGLNKLLAAHAMAVLQCTVMASSGS